MKSLLFYLCLLLPAFGSAQNWMTYPWPASWITHPTAPATEFAVVNFRRTFEVVTLPDSLPVMVSADNRYQLFVNGQRVGEGPARGDLLHWRYETYDLRPYLRTGKNVIAAIVWNYGIDKPYSQESYRLGFLLQPRTDAFAELGTDENWQTFHNEAYSPILGAGARLRTYYVTGPQLRIDGNRMPWGWELSDFDDQNWPAAKNIVRAGPPAAGTEVYWGLVPREIPMLERRPLVRPQAWWLGNKEPYNFAGTYTIGMGETKRLLIDMKQLSNFFLKIGLAGSKDARVKITYAESLFNEDGTKGQRDITEGKHIRGIYDIITPFDESFEMREGKIDFSYETLWFRTARFVEVELKAGETENLTITHLGTEEFTYPFTSVASFTDPVNTLRTNEIWQVGWQTARMCAQETYVDCPYYEQLQYVGDTRIQALISLYVSGDDRLMRKAIKLFDESRTSDGLTQSRYPSKVPQVIPPYSLSWVEMVGDYWMHRPDTTFVHERLDGVRSVLEWYHRQLLPNGLIGPTPYWNFVDWTDDWPWNNVRRDGGVPDLDGGSSILSLQYLHALRTAASLHNYFGDTRQAGVFQERADRLANAVAQLCWNADRQMFSDTPQGDAFSQHANILALLTDIAPAPALSGAEVAAQKEASLLRGPDEAQTDLGTAPENKGGKEERDKGGKEERMKGGKEFQASLLTKVLTDTSLTQVSEYFRFYLVQALHHTGNAHLYADQLKIWEAYLEQGFTTFPEKPGETRSDCHAWSASPNYDLLATLAGIRPASPGYERISIKPAHLPGLEYYATAAHPKGLIHVRASGAIGMLAGNSFIIYRVQLPAETTGVFEYGAQSFALQAGENELKVELGKIDRNKYRRH